MLLARVVGTVVSNRKDERLEGLKLLVLQQVDMSNQPTASYVVAVDSVGAGVDEVVLFATGSSARQTRTTENRPVDATVMAIVDSWDIQGDVQYQKL